MGLTLDDVFRAVANPTRRQILTALAVTLHRPMTLSAVLGTCQDRNQSRVQAQDRDRSAHHVTNGPPFDELRSVLKPIRDRTAGPVLHE